jgi:hypothetical protein
MRTAASAARTLRRRSPGAGLGTMNSRRSNYGAIPLPIPAPQAAVELRSDHGLLDDVGAFLAEQSAAQNDDKRHLSDALPAQ